MGLLDVKNLSFKYDNQIEKVFDNVSFQIDTNWKLGLIGRNGKGKTTLLELLMSKYEYRGYITPNYIFDYFPYHIENENIRTLKIVENILGEFELWELQRELSLLDVENEVLEQNFATLSKGQQTKVLLAILFCKPHDFILIDEPTNHLDYHGRLLLSKYLKRKKSFILVSHDRDFLDRCIDHVLAINRNSIEVIKGNFSLWYDLKMNNDKREIEKNEQLKKDIGRLKKAARQNEDWSNKVEATKSVKVAGLKPDKGYVGHKAAKMMQRSKNIERRQSKAIEEKSDLLKNIETIEKLKIFPLEYSKQQLCYFNHVTISYDKHIIVENLSFDINQGDRLNLAGKNGSGKIPLKNGYELVKTQTSFLIRKEEAISLSPPCLLEFGKSVEFEDYTLSFSEFNDVSNADTISIWSDSPIVIRHRKEGDKIDLGSHHKKLRRLFIDNKILEKDRQKAIIGEQDGQIIFLYVAGRLYLKKRPENAILYGTVVIYKNF